AVSRHRPAQRSPDHDHLRDGAGGDAGRVQHPDDHRAEDHGRHHPTAPALRRVDGDGDRGVRELPQPAQQLARVVPAEIERGQRAVPDVPHQVSRSLANETATLLVIPAVAVSLVAAQFAPVPSHQSGRAAAADVVALVNGAAIRAGDVEAAMNTIVPMTAYHQSLKPEKLASVRTQAIDGLIDEELRYQEAVRLKIHVPDADVDLAFARAKKSYHDEQEFERLRKASGATVAQIRASILRALMIQRVYEQAVGGRCRVSEAEAGAFYRDNTARFLMPEQLKVSLITIGVDPSAPAADWEKARQKARDVSQRLAGGASFEALARESSTDESKSKGGD